MKKRNIEELECLPLEFDELLSCNGGAPTANTSFAYDVGYYIGSGIAALWEWI